VRLRGICFIISGESVNQFFPDAALAARIVHWYRNILATCPRPRCGYRSPQGLLVGRGSSSISPTAFAVSPSAIDRLQYPTLMTFAST
jgi:hypothetical protein